MPEETTLPTGPQGGPACAPRRATTRQAIGRLLQRTLAGSASAPRRVPRILAGITVTVYIAVCIILTICVLATQNFFLLPLVMLMSLQIAYMFRLCVNFLFLSSGEALSTERGGRKNGKKR
ncbi:MAG TPA: hypothetical protein VGF67_06200 [Ktedonobacteraceae bacterium]|jgi:hypothetical protein